MSCTILYNCDVITQATYTVFMYMYHGLSVTVDREIFVVKKSSWLPQTMKILHTKFISQPIIASCL